MADNFIAGLMARGVDPIQIANPLDVAAKAAQVGAAQNQNALSGMQTMQAARAVGVQNELDRFDGKDPSSLSYAAQKQYASDSAAQRKSQIEQALNIHAALGQIMSGVKDQRTYDIARQQAIPIVGIDAVRNLNPIYDPNEVEMHRQQAMSVKDQLDKEYKLMDIQSRVEDRKDSAANRAAMLLAATMNANTNRMNAETKANGASGAAGLDDESINRIADQAIANGGVIPAGMISIGKAGQADRVAVNKRITEKLSGDGATDWGAKAQELNMTRAEIDAQKKANRDFASGVPANKLNANRTAFKHIDALTDLFAEIDNGSLQTANQIKNFYLEKTGDPGVTSVNAAKAVVAKEIINAIVLGGGGIDERKEAEHNLSTSLSDQQFAANVAAYKDLLSVRNDTLLDQAKAAGVSDKIVSPYLKKKAVAIPMSAIRQAAQDHGISVEEAMQDAINQGHQVYDD